MAMFNAESALKYESGIYVLSAIRCQLARSLTVGSDLPSGAIGGHALLAGALVGAVLQSDHTLAGLQRVLVELALVLGRLARAERRTLVADLLGLKSES